MYLVPSCKLSLLLSSIWTVTVSASIPVLDTSNDINQMLQSKSGIRFKYDSETLLNTSTTCFRFVNYKVLDHQYLFKLGSFFIGVSISQDNTLYSYGSNVYFWPENGDIVTTLYMTVKDDELGFRIVSYEIQEWPMNSWNTFCFAFSMLYRRFSVFINGKNVLSKKFIGFILLSEDLKLSSFSLMAKNPGSKFAYPLIGKITDIHVWSRELSKKEMENWALCLSYPTADIFSYDVDKLIVKDLLTKYEEKSLICAQNEAKNSMSFMIQEKGFTYWQIAQYCSNLGAKMSIAHSNAKATELVARLKDLQGVCGNKMYTGHKLNNKTSRFTSISGVELLTLDKWLEGEPNNFGGKEDCVELKVHNLYGSEKWGLNDVRCDKQKCPSCELHEYQQLQFRGVCSDGGIPIDTQFYVPPRNKSESVMEIMGYVSSKIRWNMISKSWEIVDTFSNDVIAMTNDTIAFPLGANNWYFTNGKCSDGVGNPFRRMNLHLKTDDDKFCCTDGFCIDWSLRCDNIPNCRDESDEYNCSVLIIPNDYDETKQPLLKNSLMVFESYTTELKNDINVRITILEIFNFDEEKSTITLKYKLLREWSDNRLYFRDLSLDDTQNGIDIKNIWYPRFEKPSNMKMLINTEYHGIFVRRKNNFTKFNSKEELLKSKIFEGGTNSIVMSETQHVELFCIFDQLAMYPFDEEVCEMRIKLKDIHSSFVNILPQLIDNGPTSFSQYNIKEWKIAVENEESILSIVVELHLQRNIGMIFMVVYFPTILINIINQSMNYLNTKGQFVDFATIIKVNVTCMIVISMLYDSVSRDLISTPEIKKIEVWLISSLIYPFVCIIINIRLRLLGNTLSKVGDVSAVKKIMVGGVESELHEEKMKNVCDAKIKESSENETVTRNENLEVFSLQLIIFYVLPSLYVIFIISYFTSALLMKY